jgi:hypothetical protein
MRLTVVLDCLDPAGLLEFWTTALGYRHADSLPGYEILLPREGEPPGPVFVLQRVPEPKTGKNRMHVDVHPPAALGVSGLATKLEELGGTRVGGPVTELLDTAGIWWQVMRDPEGHELCVVADPGHVPPA